MKRRSTKEMKELSSLRMAPPDMIVLGKEKGESDK